MKIQETGEGLETRREKQKKNKKKFGKRRPWIKFILICVLSLVLLVLLALSPLFVISRVEVYGNQHYKQEELVGLSGVVKGNNGFRTIGSDIKSIFLLRFRKAEKSILKNCPYIKDVKVRFVLPDKIEIRTIERKGVGLVPCLGTNLLIDDEGYVMDTINDTKDYNLPLIEGLKFERYELGQALKTENDKNREAGMKVIRAMMDSDGREDLKIFNTVKSIDVSDLQKIYVFIDSRLVVNMGDLQELNYRISFLKQIFFKTLKKEDRGLLDFTTGDRPNFMPER